MGINFKVLFYTTISLIIVSCNSYNEHSYNNGTDNKFIITGEQYTYKHKSKKPEKISIFVIIISSCAVIPTELGAYIIYRLLYYRIYKKSRS